MFRRTPPWGYSASCGLAATTFLLCTAGYASARLTGRASGPCKVFPGDGDWPDNSEWAKLNDTVGGALIKTIPHAAVCHSSWPQYNASACAYLYNNWGTLDIRVADPTDIMYPYFEGFSCLPSLNDSTPCTIGGYPEYAVNVSNSDQIAAAFKFAHEKNIRLVIKNTGHDINGKSTGAGALSIWTHNMKNIDFIPNYSDGYYTGAVLKAGAGVLLEEYYLAAKGYGVTVVGGECNTVGVAGGYFSGGGHSPVGGMFGMAADNVVAIEAVLPDGSAVKIDNSTNPDLFWAFRGGGGSTFGVVTSITVKAHPQIPVTVSWFSFGTDANTSNDTFWDSLRLYFDYMPTMSDSKSQAFAFVLPVSVPEPGFEFIIYAMVTPNKTVDEWQDLMNPLFNSLEGLGINLTQRASNFDNYYDAWTQAFPAIVGGYTDSQSVTGSRLIPRANWENATLFNETFQAFKDLGLTGHNVLMYTESYVAPPGVDNAVNPAFCPSLVFTIIGNGYTSNSTVDQINAAYDDMLDYVYPKLRAISPGSGTYMNEANSREPDFQQSFWGSHYPRLLEIKQKVDPESILYAPTAVGSEYWYVENDNGLPDVQTGRLCKKNA